ncbi:MAG TPA: hypothetical protein VGD38_02005 [Pyrinomonadaceae bacterium]
MNTAGIENNWSLIGLEWIARVASLASIALLAMIFLGEPFQPSQISFQEWVGLSFFPIGVVVGMIIAWRKEALGGVVTVASLAGFYLVYGYLFRNHIGGWFFLAFAAPGFLFLFHWLLSRPAETAR